MNQKLAGSVYNNLLQDRGHLGSKQAGGPGLVPERPGQKQEIYQQVEGPAQLTLQVQTDVQIYLGNWIQILFFIGILTTLCFT